MSERSHALIEVAAEAAAALSANGGAWNAAARAAALERLAETGLPRTHDEEWRFTPLASLETENWVFAPPPAGAPAYAQVQGLDPIRLVLVDGYLDRGLSDLPEADGVLTLRRGSAAEPFGHLPFDRPRAFEGLNLAATPDPFVLEIDGDLSRPLHIVHFSGTGERPRVASPCFRVELARGARARIVEDHQSHSDSRDLVNLRIDLEIGPNAHLGWTRIVRSGPEHRHVGRMTVRQARDSGLRMHSMTLGGALVRHDVEVLLDGENSQCELFGLVVGDRSLIADNHSLIRHRASHARSVEHFRNVLDERSRAVFAGRVVVEEGVTGTDARQSNANLLLSPDARVDALPQLEIYNDDVKASHGSTLGQLDREAMFYLRSRGIDESAARAILTWAFANVVVEEIDLPPLRDLVRRSVLEHLPSAGIDESVLGGLA